MEIKQFEDKNLAHFSYAILSNGEVALIDPARDPKPYYEFAQDNNAKIKAVIETHPHADFVSSHYEIHKTTDAKIYVSELLGAEYPHEGFDEGAVLKLGDITLQSLNTPGHSPDSISIVLYDEQGNQHAVFTGDTLFIGDCGRPDLREKAGAITSARETLARQMYHSLRDKLAPLSESTLVYPAHGAGSLCGKGLSAANSSTIGNEKMGNWSMGDLSEEEFVNELLADQPFVPKYFPFNVALNKKGADNYEESIAKIVHRAPVTCDGCLNSLQKNVPIIDTRPQALYKKSHVIDSINLMEDNKFETWLGSIISPDEKFYLAGENEEVLNRLIARIAKIGYESQILMAFPLQYGNRNMEIFDAEKIRSGNSDYTLIDIRNHSETKARRIFADAIHIPLHELRERTNEIPRDKPIVVHCAGGYRSAAGSSIIRSEFGDTVEIYDLSDAVKTF